MRVLQVHNKYRQRAGEYHVVLAERNALRRAGHEVDVFERDNRTLDHLGIAKRLGVLVRGFANEEACRELRCAIQRRRPDVAHVHNVFPIISPEVYRVLHDARVPIAQTVHNFRLWCPCGTLYHRGKVCEDGVGRPWRAIRDRCYRDSYILTAWYAAITARHWRRKTFDLIDTFIAPTEFVSRKLVAFHVEPARIRTKPHFVPPSSTHGVTLPAPNPAGTPYALYAGRLDACKGAGTLIAAARRLEAASSPAGRDRFRLVVVGSGPSGPALRADAPPNVEFLGEQNRDTVLEMMAGCRLVVFPSEWHEIFGLTLIEAFRQRKPIVASRVGSIPETVHEDHGGKLFEPGDAEGLANAVRTLWDDEETCRRMGEYNHEQYCTKYSEEPSMRRLLAIYEDTIRRLASTSGSVQVAE